MFLSSPTKPSALALLATTTHCEVEVSPEVACGELQNQIFAVR